VCFSLDTDLHGRLLFAISVVGLSALFNDVQWLRQGTEEGWLFLAVAIDLFSRKAVGWSMRLDMHRSLVIDALEMGLLQRRPK
jgi:hypothetical protein